MLDLTLIASFEATITMYEVEAWNNAKTTTEGFLKNKKDPNYKTFVNKILKFKFHD